MYKFLSFLAYFSSADQYNVDNFTQKRQIFSLQQLNSFSAVYVYACIYTTHAQTGENFLSLLRWFSRCYHYYLLLLFLFSHYHQHYHHYKFAVCTCMYACVCIHNAVRFSLCTTVYAHECVYIHEVIRTYKRANQSKVYTKEEFATNISVGHQIPCSRCF